MKIKFNHWKDHIPHRFAFGRNAHLRDIRSWTLVAGKHYFTVEIHGMGPNP